MIKASFFKKDGQFIGFEISGHAGYAQHGEDIVCASVSSAVQLTANALTEVAGVPANIDVKDDTVAIEVLHFSEISEILLESLYLHLKLLGDDYSDTIDIHILEVE